MIRRYRRCWATLSRAQRRLILLIYAMVALANVAQPFPDVAPLQHIPTILLLVASPLLLARWRLSDRATASIAAFLLLHTFAARWTYSNVPYDRWALQLTGRSISDVFGLTRNGFDRVVHLSFGLLAIRPVAEFSERYAAMSRRAALMVAILFVGAVSALYEVFEWCLSMTVSAGLADDYNGQQGDPWDAQKDMAIAIVGAMLSAAWRRMRGWK